MEELVGGLLIPAKGPIGERYDEIIPPGNSFSRVQVIMRHQRNKHQQREIALVVDCTNTSRYYSPQDWRAGVHLVKIPCRGHGEVPQPEAINQLVYEVMKVKHSVEAAAAAVPGNCKRCVLVHCSTVEKCLDLLAEARPPGSFKPSCIESLYTFYHERGPDPLPWPQLPKWKGKAELEANYNNLGGEVKGRSVDDEDEEAEGSISSSTALTYIVGDLDATMMGPQTMTNDDVLGDAIPPEQQLEMQKYICYALGLPTGSQRQPPKFPGSQPVSLTRSNLQLLRERYYYASWKADGTRYMMFLTRDGCYLIDRNFQFRRVQYRFPLKDKSSKRTHHLTLLDGEMVIDKLPHRDVRLRTYLAFDLIILNANSLQHRPFHERWKLMQDEVLDPRSSEKRIKGGQYMYEAEEFSVKRKDFWKLSTAEKLLTDFIPKKLCHEADGLILQGWDDLYVTRTHQGLLKWKYASMNTVDFLLRTSPSGKHQLFLTDRGNLRQLDGAEVKFSDNQDSSTMLGKVIECSWNSEETHWEVMRIRKDKDTPNAWHVYENILKSLHDKITEKVLLERIGEICQLPMYADGLARQQRERERGE